MKKIIYITQNSGSIDAAGIRNIEIAKLISKAGYDVSIVSNKYLVGEKNAESNIEGFKFYFVNTYPTGSLISRIMNTIELVLGRKTVKKIKSLIREQDISAVLLYDSTAILAKRVVNICKLKKIPVYGDVTEWYEKREKQSFNQKIGRVLNNTRICKVDDKMDGQIVISRFFEDYYLSKKVKVMRIPPIFSSDTFYYQHETEHEILRLVYAGSPAQKDLLKPIFNVIDQINADKINVHFDVIGINSEVNYKGIEFYGYIPHEQVLKIIRTADFSILLREDKRYAKAGYSTKFAENMSNSVAMICNTVGGCDADIIDGVNGILIKDYSEESISICLNALLEYSPERIKAIKEAAYKFAVNTFNSDLYLEKMKSFLSIEK